MSPRSALKWMLPVATVIVGIAAAQAPPPAAPVPTPAVVASPRTLDVPDGALVAAGKPPEIDVLYTGDVIGYIEPCG
jgi:hypothetical protein